MSDSHDRFEPGEPDRSGPERIPGDCADAGDADGGPFRWEAEPPDGDEPDCPRRSAQTVPEPQDGPFPWDEPAAAGGDDPDAPRERHDAFTDARKCAFLRALVKAGCILDACRLTGVSARTVYRHQDSDPGFDGHIRAALRMAATPVELTAWQRAVEGVEQEFACGGQIHVRRRYSDGLLRLLLQGSNPKKYGARPGFTRKRLLKHEKKQMEREIRAELETSWRPRSLDEVKDSILTKLEAIEGHRTPKRLAAGWTRTPDGDWIPPGYGPLPGGPAAPEGEGPGPEPPRDSL